MVTYTIYYHTFPNGKMYFGQTNRKPEKRWGKDGKGYRHQPLMWKAIQKYGWDNIDHRIISIGLDKDEADFQEMFYISAYRTNEIEFGYNITKGGESTTGITYKLSDETKQKMKIAAKGRNKGIHRGKETRKKMSDSKKGKPQPKFKWLTPDGEIKEMSISSAKQHHPDWVLITE